MFAAAATGVLVDAVALAVIQEPCLTGGAGLRILPSGEPSFGMGDTHFVKFGYFVLRL